jgi:putative ABC transport system permease protein
LIRYEKSNVIRVSNMRTETIVSQLRALACRIRGFFSSRRLDADFQDELSSHLSMLEDENLRRGLAPDEARRRARLRLGAETPLRETHHDLGGLPWLESLLQDIRFGLRMLRKSPGFTAVAILTLALGIGANTAIFSVVNAVLLRPLPVPDAARVVFLHDRFPAIGIGSIGVSARQFRDYSAFKNVFQSTALMRGENLNITVGNQTQRLRGFRVTASYFPLLGIRPIVGRTFTPSEDTGTNNHVVILSAGLWKRLFASDPHIIEKTVQLENVEYRVIGVMPQSIAVVDSNAQLWVPMGLTPNDFAEAQRWTVIFHMLARIRPGISLEQARAAMALEAARVKVAAANDPKNAGMTKGFDIVVQTIPDALAGSVRRPLYLLLGAVFLVLLVACTNVANLLLGRGNMRSRELAVRAAIGAGRRRLIVQLLTESMMLALFGGAVGVLLAYGGVHLLIRFVPESLLSVSAIPISPSVMGFTLAVAALSGILFGLVPAIQVSRVDLAEELKQAAGAAHSSAHRHGFRRALIVSEAALTCMLLIGAGLLLRTVSKLLNVNPGFDPANVMTLRISPSDSKYPPANPTHLVSSGSALLDRVSAMPGVLHAALALDPPLFNDGNTFLFTIRGYHPGLNEPKPHAAWICATPDYFAAMRIPLLRGRLYTQSEMAVVDSKRKLTSVVIDEALAQRLWSGQDPIGKQLGLGDKNGRWWTVVGVVGTVRESSLVAKSSGMIYFPWYYPGATLVVRTASNPTPLIPSLKRQIYSVDPSQAVYDVQTMSQRVAASIAQQRFAAALLALFAGLAVVLAAVGLYGVTAYAVSTRTREIGIRIALGAEPRRILCDVLREGGATALVGIVIGLALSLGFTRVISAMLFGVAPTDPTTFVAVSLILFLTALLACYLPARRASRTDPMTALRHE